MKSYEKVLCPNYQTNYNLISKFPTTIYGITSIQRKYSLAHLCTETSQHME